MKDKNELVVKGRGLTQTDLKKVRKGSKGHYPENLPETSIDYRDDPCKIAGNPRELMKLRWNGVRAVIPNQEPVPLGFKDDSQAHKVKDFPPLEGLDDPNASVTLDRFQKTPILPVNQRTDCATELDLLEGKDDICSSKRKKPER